MGGGHQFIAGSARLAGQDDVRIDSEQAGIEPGFSGDIAFNVTRNGRLDDDGISFNLDRIPIASGRVDLKKDNLVGPSGTDRLGVARIPEKSNGGGQIRHGRDDQIGIHQSDTRRAGASKENLRLVKNVATGIGVDFHVEAAHLALQCGNFDIAKSDCIHLGQIGRWFG